MNVRVEYEPTPIRHIAVQCSYCGKWFSGWDVVDSKDPLYDLRDSDDIAFAEFTCPVCGKGFGGVQNNDAPLIEKVGSAEECYKDCLKKKEVWM